jgi:hypothetical protein
VAVNDDLDQIEKTIRQLGVEWDKFFAGLEKKPPHELRNRLDQMVKKYAYQELRNSTERFRYQSLATRYATFTELWNKRMRALEEGRAVGIHVTPALVHQMQVAIPRAVAEELQAGVGHAIDAPIADGEGAPATMAPAATAPRPQGGPSAPREIRVQDPSRDQAAVHTLFEQFAAARQSLGETVVGLEKFRSLIAQQTTRILAEKGGSAVEFRVETKDGKVSLKAKLVR